MIMKMTTKNASQLRIKLLIIKLIGMQIDNIPVHFYSLMALL